MKNEEKCAYSLQDVKLVQDTLYVLSGKWKLLIILALMNGHKRFMDIQRATPKITTRMLSKELKEMEANQLIIRIIKDDYPVVAEYNFTEYSRALTPVVQAMVTWGKNHRKLLFRNS